MTRSSRSSLRSTPLAAVFAATLALWGCGGDGGGGTAGKGGGGGSAGKGGGGGSAGKGGAGGSTSGTGGNTTGTAGRGGTGGSATGTAGTGGSTGTGGTSATGTAGTGGSTGTGGTSATGTAGTGGSTGTGGTSATGTAGTGGSTGTGGTSATGTAGTGGSTGTGGSSATGTAGTGGSTGTGGSSATGTAGTSATGTAGTGGSTGTGGTAATCTQGAACSLPGAGGATGTLSGVCVNGSCTNCAADSTCQTAYGANHICLGTGASANCVAGDCHQNSDCTGKICSAATNFCTDCAGDTECVTAYGANHLCQSGTCVAGNCRNNGDCATGLICNASSQCVSCNGSDAACASYGTGYICVSNSCVMGTCHNNTECSGGQVCNASHVCAACTTDGQCGSGKICVGTGAAATCMTGNCHANNDCSNGQVCLSNSCADCTQDSQCASTQICLSGGCVTGNCRGANNCSGGQICANNNCAACTTDGQCVSGYGADHICNGSGACIPGNCHAAGQCTTTSQICNTSSLFCEGCTTDGQCSTEYNGARICISNVCVVGNCHTTAANCTTGGQVCNLTSHACETCTTDSQCADVANYGANHICLNNACVMGNCHVAADCNNPAQICNGNSCGTCTTNAQCQTAYGTNHVCAAGACVSGNCNSSSECGNNQLCLNHSCTACTTDTQCVTDTTYGAMHICLGTGSNAQCVPGNCHDTSADCMNGQICGITTAHTCGSCGGSDTACRNDAEYGTGTICLTNACVDGDCHDTSNDCAAGKICGVSTAHTCGSCGTDAQCTGDGRYGGGNICYQGNCQVGNCHAISNDCTGGDAGRLCGVSTPLVCGSCTSDSQCTSDTFYGTSTICNTAQGKCVSAACTTNSAACPANSGDFCCSNTCVPGNCCSNTDCANNPAFGAGYACTNNTCTRCDGITGNTYYVDPVNGNDTAATGSGKSGGVAAAACSFKTVTRAMAVIGTFAGTGTRVIIVGSGSTATGLAAGDSLPITVQPNVTVTTTGGPITIVLPNATSQANPTNTSGFILSNANSGVAGDAAAPLVLNGNGNLSGIAVSVSGTGTTLSNLTIQNTRGHGVSVTGGTLAIGAGVVVTGAGNTAAAIQRDDLSVSGGVVTITNASGTQTLFTKATGYGIEVSGTGSVNITGTATVPPTGNGTVVTSLNTLAGLRVNQTPGGTGATGTISGLVSWGNSSDGARLYGGSKVKIRNSVFGASTRYGVGVFNDTSGSGTAAQRLDVTNIDLGTSVGSDWGNNWLQTPTTSLGRNTQAGLCVNLGNATATGTLRADGNELITGNIGTAGVQINCATTVGTVSKNGNVACNNGAAYGKAVATTVTTTLNQCN